MTSDDPTPPAAKKGADEITIYTLPGSQFTAKVLSALDARGIPHRALFVPIPVKARKAALPGEGILVPQMVVAAAGGDGGETATTRTVVTGSEDILIWFDDHGYEPKLFPVEEAGALSTRASDGILAGAAWYFNWVDPAGYANSMRKALAMALAPAWLGAAVGGFVADLFARESKAKFRRLSQKALAVEEGDMADRAKIMGILTKELTYFQSFLKEDDQPYLLGGESTAADFAIYAQVERLVGTMGDCRVPCSVPELPDETTPELARFWQWYEGMKAKHPIRYKGKEPLAAPASPEE